MKTTLFMAMSINGVIARKNGSEDFLPDLGWKTFSELVKKSGCLITSRKTYEDVMKRKDGNFDELNAVKIIVSKKELKLKNNYLISNSPEKAIKEAERLGCKEVILSAGPSLIKSFIEKNLIDEAVINVCPVLVGKGTPLIEDSIKDKKLKLLSIKKLDEGVIQISYKLIK